MATSTEGWPMSSCIVAVLIMCASDRSISIAASHEEGNKAACFSRPPLVGWM